MALFLEPSVPMSHRLRLQGPRNLAAILRDIPKTLGGICLDGNSKHPVGTGGPVREPR